MSKILFDLKSTQPSSEGKRHGGGKYGEIVLKRIIERGLPVSCYYTSSLWLNPEIKKLLDDNNIKQFDLAKQSVTEIIKNNDVRYVFVPAALNGKYWRNTNVNVLGVIHGLRGLETPLDSGIFRYKLSLKEFFKEIIKRTSKYVRQKKQKAYIKASLTAPNIKVVTVSNHSSSSFKCFFPELNINVPVFYSPSTTSFETNNTKYFDKYFLIVSANRPVKNNLRAIIALDNLLSNGLLKGFRVKVTGVNSDSIFWYHIKCKESFDLLGYVEEDELDQLYHDAYCFIYPTINEGFGYPPLEAMHYGVPVLTAAISAVPEVCAGSVLYFNPFSVEEIMNRILIVLNKDVHDEYSKKAIERYHYIKSLQNRDLDRLIDYMYSIY